MDPKQVLFLAERPEDLQDWKPVEVQLRRDPRCGLRTTVCTPDQAASAVSDRTFDLLVATHSHVHRPRFGYARSLCLPSTATLEERGARPSNSPNIEWDAICFGGHDLDEPRGRLPRALRLLTGVPRLDALVVTGRNTDLVERLGLDPHLPTLVAAYTGAPVDATWLEAVRTGGPWNLLVVDPDPGCTRRASTSLDEGGHGMPRVRMLRGEDPIPLMLAADLLLTDRPGWSHAFGLRRRPLLFGPPPDPTRVAARIRSALLPAATDEAMRPPSSGPFRPGEASHRCAGVVRSMLGLGDASLTSFKVLPGLGPHAETHVLAAPRRRLGSLRQLGT